MMKNDKASGKNGITIKNGTKPLLLFTSSVTHIPLSIKEVLSMLISEIENALQLLKSDKAAGKGGITTELLGCA